MVLHELDSSEIVRRPPAARSRIVQSRSPKQRAPWDPSGRAEPGRTDRAL